MVLSTPRRRGYPPLVRSRAGLSLGCVLSVLLVSPALRAERALSERLGPVRLVYERQSGAETCPDESAFRDAVIVRARAGSAPFAEDADARLLMTIRAVPGRGYVAHAELANADVPWTSDLGPAVDCQLLVSAMVLDVAALFHKALPRPFQGVAPVEPIIDQPRSSPKPRARPDVRLGLTVGSAFGVGTAVAAPLLSLDVGLRWGPFSLSAQGRAAFPIAGDVGKVHLSFSRYAGALVPCGHAWYFVGCVVTEFGAVHLSNHPARPEGTTVFWAGLGARAGLEFPLGASPVALRFSGEALIALQRVDLYVDSVSRWAAPPVSGSLEAGALVFF